MLPLLTQSAAISRDNSGKSAEFFMNPRQPVSERMQCTEVWGGSRATWSQFSAPGLDSGFASSPFAAVMEAAMCTISSCDSSESSWLTCEAMKCQTTLSVACACLHHRLIFYRSSSDSHRPRPHPVAPVSNASPRVPGAGPLCIRSLFICVETSPE